MQKELTFALELRKQGKLEESKDIILKLSGEHPEDAYISYQCAWSYDALGMEDKAVPYYEKAIEKGLSDEDLQGALLGLGSTYRTLGKYHKSREIFEKAILLFPDNKAFQIFYSMTLYNLSDFSKAMEILLKNLVETTKDENIKKYEKAIEFYADKLDIIWD